MRFLFLRTLSLLSASLSKLMATPVAMLSGVYVGLSAAYAMHGEIMPTFWCWAAPMLILIYLDTSSGVAAARYRQSKGSKEKVTVSTLLKGLLNKILAYGGWAYFSLSMGYLTDKPVVGLAGMIASVTVELVSFIENKLEVKGLGINWAAVWSAIKNVVSSKTGVSLGGGDIITKSTRGCGALPQDEENNESKEDTI